MTEFEKLYQQQLDQVKEFKEKYQLSEGFIQRIRDREHRYPTEEECQAYLERRMKRLANEHKSTM